MYAVEKHLDARPQIRPSEPKKTRKKNTNTALSRTSRTQQVPLLYLGDSFPTTTIPHRILPPGRMSLQVHLYPRETELSQESLGPLTARAPWDREYKDLVVPPNRNTRVRDRRDTRPTRAGVALPGRQWGSECPPTGAYCRRWFLVWSEAHSFDLARAVFSDSFAQNVESRGRKEHGTVLIVMTHLTRVYGLAP